MLKSLLKSAAVACLVIVFLLTLAACQGKSADNAATTNEPIETSNGAETQSPDLVTESVTAASETAEPTATPAPTPYVPQIVKAVDTVVEPSFTFDEVTNFQAVGDIGYFSAVKQNGKWGFLRENGKLAVPCAYDEVREFTSIKSGIYFVGVKQNDKWGFVDAKGKLVVPLEYESADIFYNGRAKVGNNGKYGFVDESGRLVVPCVYQSAERFYKGASVARKDDKYGIIDENGNELVPFIYDEMGEFRDGLAKAQTAADWLFFDESGKSILTIPRSAYYYIGYFNNGLAQVAAFENNITRQGFIDKTGTMVIPFGNYTFKDSSFFNDVIVVYDISGFNCGLMDKTGKIIVPIQYEGISYNSSLATIAFSKGDVTYLYDLQGNLISTASYNTSDSIDSIQPFNNGFAKVFGNGKVGYVNENIEPITPCVYEIMWSKDFTIDKIAVVVRDMKYGVIDETGNGILPCEYDVVQMPTSSGLMYINKGLKTMANTTFGVTDSGLNGYANIAGEIIVPLEYEQVTPFIGGYALVKKNGLWGILKIDMSKNVDKVVSAPVTKTSANNSDSFVGDKTKIADFISRYAFSPMNEKTVSDSKDYVNAVLDRLWFEESKSQDPDGGKYIAASKVEDALKSIYGIERVNHGGYGWTNGALVEGVGTMWASGYNGEKYRYYPDDSAYYENRANITSIEDSGKDTFTVIAKVEFGSDEFDNFTVTYPSLSVVLKKQGDSYQFVSIDGRAIPNTLFADYVAVAATPSTITLNKEIFNRIGQTLNDVRETLGKYADMGWVHEKYILLEGNEAQGVWHYFAPADFAVPLVIKDSDICCGISTTIARMFSGAAGNSGSYTVEYFMRELGVNDYKTLDIGRFDTEMAVEFKLSGQNWRIHLNSTSGIDTTSVVDIGQGL